MAENLIFVSRLESGPLDRFKNQNLLLKKFGDDGLKVYNALEQPMQAKALLSVTGIKEQKFVTILEFMEENGIIAISDKPPAGAVREEISTIAPENETEDEPKENRNLATKKQSRESVISGDEDSTPKDEEGIGEDNKSDAEEENGAGNIIKPIGISIKPQETDDGEDGYAQKKSKPAQVEKNRIKPELNDNVEDINEQDNEKQNNAAAHEPEETSVPEQKTEHEPTPEQEKEPVDQNRNDVKPLHEEEKKIEIGEKLSREDAAAREKLSPIERIIFNKYGSTGVLVYKLIDGEKTAEEIMLETGLSEVKLVEMLEFLESQGIIKLEKPAVAQSAPSGDSGIMENGAGIKNASQESAGMQAQEIEAVVKNTQEPMFTPMIDEKETIADAPPGSALFPDIIPIDIPMPAPINPISSASVKTSLFMKFKGQGLQIYQLLDGKRDVVSIALQTKRSLSEIDQVLALLGSKKAVYFKPMTREEIKAAYGEDAFAMYKKFGREGVLIYDLIGKEPSLRDIVIRSRVEAHHAVEILLFIHSILGVDMPLSREVLYKQLGIA